MSGLRREPIDSRVAIGPRQIDTTPARAGWSFDGAGAAAAALETVGASMPRPRSRSRPPRPRSRRAHGDGEALAAKAAAERMIGDIVVTLGKQQWTIKAKTVRGWLRFEAARRRVAVAGRRRGGDRGIADEGRQGGQASRRSRPRSSRLAVAKSSAPWRLPRTGGSSTRGDRDRDRRGPREPGRRRGRPRPSPC